VGMRPQLCYRKTKSAEQPDPMTAALARIMHFLPLSSYRAACWPWRECASRRPAAVFSFRFGRSHTYFTLRPVTASPSEGFSRFGALASRRTRLPRTWNRSIRPRAGNSPRAGVPLRGKRPNARQRGPPGRAPQAVRGVPAIRRLPSGPVRG
jgi:hypothetical protein